VETAKLNLKKVSSMKFITGKYKTFWGPYQIAGLLKYVGVKEDTYDKVGEWLGETWVDTLAQWYYKHHGDQKVQVKISPWDTWSMDHTLGHIVLPMLRQLKTTKHGAPYVEPEDVPLHLRPTVEAGLDGSTDDTHFERWDWVLDEMIFAFESIYNEWESEFTSGVHHMLDIPINFAGDIVDEKDADLFRWEEGPNNTYKIDFEGMKVYGARVQNGFRLFGTYFTSLWD